jgi:hypothetical protein
MDQLWKLTGVGAVRPKKWPILSPSKKDEATLAQFPYGIKGRKLLGSSNLF